MNPKLSAIRSVFLITLGAAALGMGIFFLVRLPPLLSLAGRDPFILVVLGMVLGSAVAGAYLVLAGSYALARRDWIPGIWTRAVLYLTVLNAAVFVALPFFVKARTSSAPNACLSKQIQIDGAKAQWATEHKKAPQDMPVPADLMPYLIRNRFPICESGGTYRVGSVAEKATCSLHPREREEENARRYREWPQRPRTRSDHR